MSEYVKALKVVHQLLILAATAVFAFALTPDLDLQYQKADEVLAFLQTLSPDSWERYVVHVLEKKQREQSRQIIHALRAIDPKVSSSLTVVPFAYGEMRYPLGGGILDSIRYLSTEQTLRTVTLHIDKQALLAQWDRYAKGIVPRPPGASQPDKSIYLHIVGVDLIPPEGTYTGPRGGPHLVGYSEPGYISPSMNIFIDPASTPSAIAVGGGGVAPFDFRAKQSLDTPLTDFFARKWLEDQDQEHMLFKSRDRDDIAPLRALNPFMVSIGGMNPSQARAKLEETRDAQHGRLSLFGLSVQANLAVNVMPWITLGVIAFFIAHLRQATSSTGILHHATEGAWVGLFKDWTAQIISAVTILIMPTFANLLLVLRHGKEGSRTLQLVSVGLIACLSFWSYAELLRLKRAVREETKSETRGNPPEVHLQR